jgi:hypothetical protein
LIFSSWSFELLRGKEFPENISDTRKFFSSTKPHEENTKGKKEFDLFFVELRVTSWKRNFLKTTSIEFTA